MVAGGSERSRSWRTSCLSPVSSEKSSPQDWLGHLERLSAHKAVKMTYMERLSGRQYVIPIKGWNLAPCRISDNAYWRRTEMFLQTTDMSIKAASWQPPDALLWGFSAEQHRDRRTQGLLETGSITGMYIYCRCLLSCSTFDLKLHWLVILNLLPSSVSTSILYFQKASRNFFLTYLYPDCPFCSINICHISLGKFPR